MKSRETRLVILLCILAGIRVLVFSAGFPFFNNVDEEVHYDVICKYAAGHFPARIERYGDESAGIIAMYASPEYYGDWYQIAASQPLWKLPYETIEGSYQRTREFIISKTNHESTQAPLYYIMAGGWYDLGKMLGLRGIGLLYWLRFLNIPMYMLLVWIGYLMTRKLYPNNRFLALGVPAMLVVFPQDVFYGLNSDVPAALLATLSVYMLITYLLDTKGMGFQMLSGLSVAAALLTKVTNIPLLAFAAVILLMKKMGSRRKGEPRNRVPGLVPIVLAAAIPLVIWMLRNEFVLGEITGNHAKVVRMGWALKPLGQLFHHPIFIPSGATYFWSELMRTFWRGEIIWHQARMASASADAFYVLTSLVFTLAAAILVWKRKEERLAMGVNFLMLGLSVGFLAGLSVIYDFHGCGYPSRELPFFTSGRLMLGALVPFVMLYVAGLGVVCDWLRIGRLRWVVLSLILALALGSEVWISRDVFASAYNFYHLLGS